MANVARLDADQDEREDPLQVLEALSDAIGHQAAMTALHVLGGKAPTLNAINRAMARRRLPELLQRRPGASTRDLARWLGTSHASVQRWLREMERDRSNRSTALRDADARHHEDLHRGHER